MRPLWLCTALVAGTSAVAAAGKDGRVVRVEREPSRTTVVPGGSFVMGLSPEDLDAAVHACVILHGQNRWGGHCLQPYAAMLDQMLARDVHVDAFAIDRHEVTVAEYRACVDAAACDLDPLIAGDERYVADDALPIVNVTWDEARTFCEWRGGRLPTEAEWEKAARGTDARDWPWGDRPRPDDFNHGRLRGEAMSAVDDLEHRSSGRAVNATLFGDPDDSDGHAYAAPPGSYPWGEGPYGTFDQAGNVAEWVADRYDLDAGYLDLGEINPVRDPDAGGLVERVIRGGSWRDPEIFAMPALRTMWNFQITGDQRHPHVGFRCAYDR